MFSDTELSKSHEKGTPEGMCCVQCRNLGDSDQVAYATSNVLLFGPTCNSDLSCGQCGHCTIRITTNGRQASWQILLVTLIKVTFEKVGGP